MMMQTLNPYSTRAKTAEIMARYRPIAPRPEVPVNPLSEEPPTMTQKIQQSPYLRNVWPHLQARPTRTRKRGRTSVAPPALKRSRTYLQGLNPPPCQVTSSPAKYLSLMAFAHSPNGLPPVPTLAVLNENAVTTPATLVTLPLLPCPSLLPIAPTPELNSVESPGGEKVLDLNMVAEVPEEKDFLQQLQGLTSTNVIAPRPVRPIGSTISIRYISQDPGSTPISQIAKKPEEVEGEIETEAFPAVLSDSNNKVRLVNSAYKEMVGQPECSWLNSMVTCEGRDGGSACKRICGEVMLQVLDSGVPISSNGFSCWARIEWGSNGKNSAINAFCNTTRLSCESKDYLFAWRFHTREASETTSNV